MTTPLAPNQAETYLEFHRIIELMKGSGGTMGYLREDTLYIQKTALRKMREHMNNFCGKVLLKYSIRESELCRVRVNKKSLRTLPDGQNNLMD